MASEGSVVERKSRSLQESMKTPKSGDSGDGAEAAEEAAAGGQAQAAPALADRGRAG